VLAVAGKPALWLASAVVIGELRTRQERIKLGLQAQVAGLERRVGELQAAVDELDGANERLRTAAAAQIQTAVSLVQAVRSVETQDPGLVFPSVDGIVQSLLQPAAYSIFLLAGERLERVVRLGDDVVVDLPPRYDARTPLFCAVVDRQEVVHVASEEGQQILGDDGVIAGPLVDAAFGQVIGMIKIESLPLTMLRPDTLAAFTALCEWIGSAYKNAQRFDEANRERVTSADSRLFTDAYYQPVSAFVVALAKRVGFEVNQLTVRVTHDSMGRPEGAPSIGQVLQRVVAQGLRSTDLAFDYHISRGEYVILLPMTPLSQCQLVADRVRELLIGALTTHDLVARIAVTFETLHAPSVDDVSRRQRKPFRRTAPYT